jgi:methyl-accepting chemotaxis protein
MKKKGSRRMKDLRIGARLGIGFALVLTLMILMTGIGIARLHTVADSTKEMMNAPLAAERLISDWYRNIHSAVRRTMAVAKSSEDSMADFFAAETATAAKVASQLTAQIEPLLTTAEEKALWQELQATRMKYLAASDAISKAKETGQVLKVEQILAQDFLPASTNYMALVEKLLAMQRDKINGNASEIESIYQSSRNLLIMLGVTALIFGATAARWLTIGITRPLIKAVQVARTVASGDLTTHIDMDSKDEIGQLFHALNDMNGSLMRIVSEVRAGTDAIATASSEIAAGSSDLSSRTEQQAGSLEETASSMEELTLTVRKNADNARQANQLAMSAADVAVKGGTVVLQVVETMGSINKSSKRIVDIISVIDGIAFQTNILALNAAVEAARAGEQGRGFAVVAAEVRSLAQRSAGAAKEIKSLIGDSVEKVDAGAELVDQAGATMQEIVESVKRVTDIMGEMMAANQEQSSGIEQVNQVIGQMDQATQQNASLVEQATAASESLLEQAAKLSRGVSVFKLVRRDF